MKRIVLGLSVLMVTVVSSACSENELTGQKEQEIDSTLKQSEKSMKSYISIFEIPATDITRAIQFYQTILDIDIEKMEMPGMEMGILPYEGQMVTGVILKAEGTQPSADGVTIYLDGGNDLQLILNRVEKNGGKIIIPKTAHADDSGFFALFLDSEGNRMGLHSPG